MACTHDPALHASVVQTFPSVQAFASLATNAHAPFAGLHASSVHGLESLQTIGFVPVQAPAWHVSLWVQALPSVHDVPLGALGFEQVPVPGLHTPATWHWSLAVQVTGLAPVQAPAWQVSLCVQALPSEQDVPFGALGFEQVPVAGLHVPATWH